VRAVRASVVVVVGLAVARASAAAAPPADIAAAEQRVAATFASRGVSYPPDAVALVALKREGRLEVWADAGGRWRFIRSYLIRTTSGVLGPKLREGDHQVPEGAYGVAALNPTSRYHVALRLDYPNAFDRARAAQDGRTRLGGDIMIHGGAVSDGCLPVGDAGIEELFALAQRVGAEHVSVVVSPLDFRRAGARRPDATGPSWLPELDAMLSRALAPFALPSDDEPAPPRTRESLPRCRPYDAADCVRRCDAGDLASCARAGLLYEGGLGVAADPARAWTFLRRACGGGDAFGCAELARLHLTDDGARRDAARAAELAEIACDGGDGHGCSYLATVCNDRIVYPRTAAACASDRVARLRNAAVSHLRGDCRGWSARDCSTLADIYYPDARVALRFAAGACEGGDATGCYTLAKLAEDRGDAADAAALFARACAHGYRPACEPGVRPILLAH
jgi:hypothetical protein